jgi:translation initiation factor IF-3
VRLIGAEGEQLGIVNFQEALLKAHSLDLDLVEVSSGSTPPVCRIMDHGKELYRKNRQLQKQKAKQKKRGQKGIRLSIKMSENDLNTRLKQTHKFLDQGHRVKIEIILKGREKAHPELAKENIQKFLNQIELEIKVVQNLKRQPNGLNIIITKK